MKNTIPLLILLCLTFSAQVLAQGVELTNLKSINTQRLDFSPVPVSNGLLFTSSKSDRFLRCPSDDPGNFTDLYFAPKNMDGSYGAPVVLKGEVNGKYNDGVATINATGDKMIFTRNNLSGKNNQNIIDLKLYSADLVDQEWKNLTELPFNSDDYSSCHPTLSRDGKLLVFASNRPDPVAKGAMDLYATRLVDGNWTDPVNLGPDINTEGNELFPNLDELGNLFFSTNGHGGEGGLDIYAARQNSSEKWELLGNIGTQFNTAGDEVSFLPINNGAEGFMAAADRSGGAGLDDIFAWKRKSQLIPAIIVVVDEDTGQRLVDARVAIDPTNPGSGYDQKYGNVLDMLYGAGDNRVGREALELITNAQGSASMQVYNGGEYNIQVSKEGYRTTVRNPNTAQLTEKGEYIIPIRRNKARLRVEVAEVMKGNPFIPGATVVILNKTTGNSIRLSTDQNGAVETEIDCNHEYEITASKSPFITNGISLKDFLAECASGSLKREIYLKAPLVVYLDPIYFDFDKHNIRKGDAVGTLESLISTLKQYPSLQIHLGAHCDARGSQTYNDKLSVKRANSAKAYLVAKGVAASRIKTEAFGERKPANDCTDNVFCPENQHQVNRRVDVMPASHTEVEVEFKNSAIPAVTIGTAPIK